VKNYLLLPADPWALLVFFYISVVNLYFAFALNPALRRSLLRSGLTVHPSALYWELQKPKHSCIPVCRYPLFPAGSFSQSSINDFFSAQSTWQTMLNWGYVVSDRQRILGPAPLCRDLFEILLNSAVIFKKHHQPQFCLFSVN